MVLFIHRPQLLLFVLCLVLLVLVACSIVELDTLGRLTLPRYDAGSLVSRFVEVSLKIFKIFQTLKNILLAHASLVIKSKSMRDAYNILDLSSIDLFRRYLLQKLRVKPSWATL